VTNSKYGQIVYFGLSRLTDDRTVIRDAYQYWQNQLASETFDIVAVADKLVEYIGSDSGGKKTLMIALHAANNKSVSELPDVPKFVSGDQSFSEPEIDANEFNQSAEVNLPAHCVITAQLFKLIFDRLRRVDSSGYAELSQIIAEEGLDDTPHSLHSMIIAAPDNGLKLNSDISEQQCQALTHSLCMLVTDIVGPVVTDDIIDNVIAELLQNSQASQYDPRKLL